MYDVLRDNIGLLFLEGADHSKLIAKIAAKRGYEPTNSSTPYPEEVRYRSTKTSMATDETLQRLNLIANKNAAGTFNSYSHKTNDPLTDLRIKRFWDRGKVKLPNAPFDVRDKNSHERNFNLARAQQAARSAGTQIERQSDGRTKITTTTYDPIHHKISTSITYREPKKDKNSPFKDADIKKTNHFSKPASSYKTGALGLATGAVLGGGMYALWKRHQNRNKNKSFIHRLFGR